ncbi:hypothetical protein QQX10_03230 [Demequina sp. SYSU T00039]|uniref:Lipoprotein n=1 Tax=Demequina lignilytica TaxID=3051663 RepID=A0AAW7M729_9MICO|nr:MULTISPECIES: hypothetical protein [unclassified Demequina]MDN4478320.1 hypothetical protein [Demequina sp. SYSU T00039-1]MDN4487173.1 hypothetical protein [Demequina sp. SYSU T00039]MDN4489884.1 hypothetical protein [Demequina sp. SYSU T00068]
MRRITAVTGLLAGAALALAGCSSDSPATIEVTGTQSGCAIAPDNPGFHGNCVLDLSDERVSGTVEVEFDQVGEDGDTVQFEGSAVISNDGGTWTSDTCTGMLEDETGHVEFDCELAGTGDYEGMTFVQHLEGTSTPSQVTGTLTEG